MAEMKRFELLRRFEADLPHFECVRDFRTQWNLVEDKETWEKGKIPEFWTFLERRRRKKTEISVSKSPPKGSGILTDF